MQDNIARSVVILGGGTAGWMTAAALARALNNQVLVTVVESDEIGTVGVGESTIPHIRRFNEMLGLDENEFIRETQGTIKMGVELRDWTFIGDRYMHGFGRLRQDIKLTTFEQVWQKLFQIGRAAELSEYSVTKKAAYAGKFMRPRHDVPDSPLADIDYAFQFDAGLYARYLRRYAEQRGVQRVEGKVRTVERAAGTGDIAALAMEDGSRVAGEFFVDCSGFRGRLIEQEFHAGYDDWTNWLPCDRAFAVPCASVREMIPYTRATARAAGWQWRIPLQHRTGNGFVYASKYISDDEAAATLMANLDAEALAEPRMLRFVTGVRRRHWVRNCVAIGLSSGFLEPLESTSIHLIQTSINKLLQFFPSAVPSQPDIDEYNRMALREFEHVRDFIVLHYHATRRNDSPLWNYCRTMEIPPSLQQKMELFRSKGRLLTETYELFAQGSWFQVMYGQGLRPQAYNPLVDVLPVDEISKYMEQIRDVVGKCVEAMPRHEQFLAQNCAAQPLPAAPR